MLLISFYGSYIALILSRVVKTARFFKPANREQKDRLTVFTYLVTAQK